MADEPISNMDAWEGRIAYYGFASAETVEAPSGEPMNASVAPPAPFEPDPHSHEELRWARVCRRLAGKHRPARARP